MYEIKSLRWETLETIYYSNMQTDFPQAELKPLALLRELYTSGNTHAYGLYSGVELKAYAIFQTPRQGSIWLLDYLAVTADGRGKGVGSLLLKQLQDRLQAEAVMIEIERIDHASDGAQKEERIRRKHFYLKNGLCETGVFTWAEGVHYEVLCLPLQERIVGSAAAEAMRKIYQTFFSKLQYKIFPPDSNK